ncbi:MAG TPA: pitrilysin family protein, partial [Terriglobales bacterium]|nr:pitrilysin family protein [Terriglobales bacterium]
MDLAWARCSHLFPVIGTETPKDLLAKIRVNFWPLFLLLSMLALSIGASAQGGAQRTKRIKPHSLRVFTPNLVTLPSDSPLYTIRIMVRTGSAYDPPGKEGAANLTARMLIEGGFGDPKRPTTKDKLADITRPWGDAALPRVLVDKEATTFSVTVPRDSLAEFVARVLKPMMTQPLWLAPELDRIRREELTNIRSALRFEDEESLGLLALDDYVLAGTPLDHLANGTVRGLQATTRDDLVRFYRSFYVRDNMYVATNINDPAALGTLMDALPTSAARPSSPTLKTEPALFAGHHLLIITQPNAIATGLHLGFPIDVTRRSDDYWPLFVANVFFGVHRDSFGRLYHDIRAERGYNYGDYSYIEYYEGRPYYMFPPPCTPRTQEYFSIWIRPVEHKFTQFILKAMTAELDQLVHQGLTPEQVESAKVKARTLYLNYAGNQSRLLGYRLDDMFYGMKDHGYIQEMLAHIDAVTPDQVNAAIKKHLQTANLKYVIVTNRNGAEQLADDIANGANVVSKTL